MDIVLVCLGITPRLRIGISDKVKRVGSHAWGNPPRKVVRRPSFWANSCESSIRSEPTNLHVAEDRISLQYSLRLWNESKCCGCAHQTTTNDNHATHFREQGGYLFVHMKERANNSTDRPYLMCVDDGVPLKGKEKKNKYWTRQLGEVILKSCPLFPPTHLNPLVGPFRFGHGDSPGFVYLIRPLWPLISRLFWKAHFIAPSPFIWGLLLLFYPFMPSESEPPPPPHHSGK